MKSKAATVICAYACGNRFAERSVSRKNARGRPRPEDFVDRSTSSFVSRIVRWRRVAIFEIPRAEARSPRDVSPARLRISRIRFFVDEKPASREPGFASSAATEGGTGY